jgi:hypothetical protein
MNGNLINDFALKFAISVGLKGWGGGGYFDYSPWGTKKLATSLVAPTSRSSYHVRFPIENLFLPR